MDTSVITPYTQALSNQKTQLEGTLNAGFQAITLPSSISQLESNKLHMLGKSAIWFAVIGIVAFIAGVIMKSTGIWITGCAAMLSGGYLWMKGKQANRADAFSALGNNIYGQVQDVYKKVASDWTSFITTQNDNLKKQIVTSDQPTDAKVAQIDRIDAQPAITVDMSALQQEAQSLAAEDLTRYQSYIADAKGRIQQAIDNADGAQQSIYQALNK